MSTARLGLLVVFSASYSIIAMVLRKKALSNSTGASWLSFFKTQSWRWYGMNTAHFGFVVLVIGIATVSLFSIEKEQWLAVGETTTIGQTQITFDAIEDENTSQYVSRQAHLTLTDQSGVQQKLIVEKRQYYIRNQTTTETAISTSFFGDVFLALGEVGPNQMRAQLRMQWKPMIRFIWLGCILFALGGLLSCLQRNKKELKNT